jgi:malonyl-CoA/methylmalonyl-CoA synthetase
VSTLLRALVEPPAGSVSVGGESLTFAQLAELAGGLAAELEGAQRVAVRAESTLDTVIAVAGAVAAGVAAVPVNPAAAAREIEHIVSDSRPTKVVTADPEALPETLRELEPVAPRGARAAYRERVDGDGDEAAALVVYTSGTTGLPKGVQIPRRAIASNLDALADAWAWTAADRLAQALPLFHVHGLVLGTLGPLRLGCDLVHLGRFAVDAVAAAFHDGATMLFGVPTMYHRLADAAEADARVADALRRARLLVSGSAALPAAEHARIARLTGQEIVERYGMTETLMNTSVRVDGERIPGSVGRPLAGIELRLLDDDRNEIEASDGQTIGEIAVRGPNLFTGYLNRSDAYDQSLLDGWFLTGDLATRSGDGYIRIVGRRSTDLIKSGGYKIGAGEIENALLEHAAVAEAAVKGEPDDDLGERVVAYVVRRDGAGATEDELLESVAALLAPYKRPREIRFRDALPRNAMGKVVKSELR